ncbi:hypothetical protein Gobs01_01789 [Geodermatophilus obscurus DSM 43160]|uniref:Uncharacterized protein n=2 Tax=Geodermatophilus obscurus TaxID=1861 RepID=D2S8X6_GEOOG|nr:hypothetical protein Gobs_0855 [Geodermatophilus obscurus DSM 43160]
MTELEDAIRLAVKEEFPPSGSAIDGHDFYIRSVRNKNRLKEGETSYFRHQHTGKDDRVFYTIESNPGGPTPYTAKLTRIEFRGPFVKNGFMPLGDRGMDVTDAVNVLAASGGVASNLPATWGPFVVFVQQADLEGFLDDDWVPAAAKIADMIGDEMARQGLV